MNPSADGGRGNGKVVWSATMSLDGFIAGPDDAMGWVFDHSGPNPTVDEVISRTGAALAGRRSWDVGRLDEAPVKLESLEASSAGRVTTLRFRVLK